MDRHAALTRVSRILLGLNALIWLVFAAIVASGAHPALPEGEMYRWGLAGSALIGAVLLVTLSFYLERSPLAYYLIIVVLGLVAVMTVLDQFGFVDLAFLIVTILPLALLIRDRRLYLRGAMSPDGAG